MKLFIEKFKTTVKKYNKSNIKVLFSGRREPLSTEILSAMDEMVEITKNNTDNIMEYRVSWNESRSNNTLSEYIISTIPST